LPTGPVVNDLGTRERQCVVGIDVVEVAEAEQDVVDGLLRVLGPAVDNWRVNSPRSTLPWWKKKSRSRLTRCPR
jgi:hypothetical protein